MTSPLDPNRRAAIRDHAIRALLELPETIGRYQVRGELGRGGMGVVYHAYDPQLERDVAVKVINPALLRSNDPRACLDERFEREMRAVSPIFHPNVVTILDAGIATIAGERSAYYVMERVTGESLEDRICRSGPLSRSEALEVAVAVAKGLAALHEKGLVHRDVKPSNILLPIGQAPKLSDFGLVHLINESGGPREDSMIAGSTHGLAPEQIGAGPVDARSDLFALGALLIRMWTGHEPFAASSLTARFLRIQNDEPDGVELLPPDIGKLTLSLLSKAPAERPRNALEVTAQLEAMQRDARPLRLLYAGRILAVAGIFTLLAFGASQTHRSRLEADLTRERARHESEIEVQLERASLLARPFLSVSTLQDLPADERRALGDRIEGAANRVGFLRAQHQARIEELERSLRMRAQWPWSTLTDRFSSGPAKSLPTVGFVHESSAPLDSEEREQILQQLELLDREFDMQTEVHFIRSGAPDREPMVIAIGATGAPGATGERDERDGGDFGDAIEETERGLRFVLDLEQESGSIEPSRALEPVLPDALLGALLREQILPLVHRGQTAFGLRLAFRVIRERLRDELPVTVSDEASPRHASDVMRYAGGGARASHLASLEGFAVSLDDEQRRSLSAGATPEITWQRFVAWLGLETSDVDITILTPESREILRRWPASRPYWRGLLRHAKQTPLETIVVEDRALLYTREFPELAPTFLHRSEEGWQIDLAAGGAHILSIAGGPHRWSFRNVDGDPLVRFREDLAISNGLIRLAKAR